MSVNKKFKILIYPGLHARPGSEFVKLCQSYQSSVTINVDWTEDHAYVITGDVELSEINITHEHDSQMLDVGIIYDTTGENLRIILNTSVSNGDIITVQAGDVTRIVNVGLWGQPIADHEVTLNSHWEMDQQWENENGTQKYILLFDGQGWQQRIGSTLESWEMGNGSLLIVSNTADSSISMMIDLDSVWKNETTVDGVMTAQVFDARGSGMIGVGNDDDEGNPTAIIVTCLLYTSPSPRDRTRSRMPSSA
mgnify:CR=1 FL=1